ncbi:hypothetical protein D3C74_443610 [compost metagenome]
MDRPALRASFNTPIASRSLQANTAVGRSATVWPSIAAAALRPFSSVAEVCVIFAGLSKGIPAAFSASSKPSARSLLPGKLSDIMPSLRCPKDSKYSVA